MDNIKFCQVCGDFACAVNHQALTCHSCRMFFKRNATKYLKLKCFRNGTCKIDSETRASCQKCRLEKCFSLGMKVKQIPVTRPRKVYTANCRVILDTFITEQLFKLLVDFEANTAAPSHTYLPDHLQHQLNPHEQSLLNEVDTAMSVFVDENNLTITGSKKCSIAVLNMFSLYASKIVKFCKNIAAFKELKQADQLIILKPFYFEIIVIRVAYLYNEEKNGFPFIQNEFADGVIFVYLTQKHLINMTGNYQNKRFVKVLQDELENDSIIRNLLIAQSLFKPRENISCPEFIRYNFMLYTNLLQRYLEHKYGDTEKAAEKFSSLIDMNKEFCLMRDKVLAYLKTVDINQITDLMAEVFDIK